MAQFAGSAHWAEPSPLFAHGARPTPVKCKNEYLLLALGEGTEVQAVVGSMAWAFRRLKKAKESGDERPWLRAYGVCPLFSFLFLWTFLVVGDF